MHANHVHTLPNARRTCTFIPRWMQKALVPSSLEPPVIRPFMRISSRAARVPVNTLGMTVSLCRCERMGTPVSEFSISWTNACICKFSHVRWSIFPVHACWIQHFHLVKGRSRCCCHLVVFFRVCLRCPLATWTSYSSKLPTVHQSWR